MATEEYPVRDEHQAAASTEAWSLRTMRRWGKLSRRLASAKSPKRSWKARLPMIRRCDPRPVPLLTESWKGSMSIDEERMAT